MPSPDGAHWFEALADHMGPAYLRYSFTMGTRQEVDFLVEVLELAPGDRLLDVGCGPGRHANELARRGIEVVGVDIAARFVEVADAAGISGATFIRADATALPFDDGPLSAGSFDAAISLCQGAFGLGGGGSSPGDPQRLGTDLAVLGQIRHALRDGGRAVVSAFSAYFQLRWLADEDEFDAAGGVNHERTEIRDSDGRAVPAELWTTCTTPRELRLMSRATGLATEAIWSVAPGAYARRPPSIDSPEFLLLARRQAPAMAGADPSRASL